MAQKRRTFDPKFKAQVALEALKERQTLNELAARYQLTPQTISLWKQQLLEQAPELFRDRRRKSENAEPLIPESELYQQIGQLTMEVEWLKKKSLPRP